MEAYTYEDYMEEVMLDYERGIQGRIFFEDNEGGKHY